MDTNAPATRCTCCDLPAYSCAHRPDVKAKLAADPEFAAWLAETATIAWEIAA